MLPTPSALFSCLALTAMASATPVIRVMSPAPSQVSSPVHYVASATSPGCAKGIAALRIYLAPHLAAFDRPLQHSRCRVATIARKLQHRGSSLGQLRGHSQDPGQLHGRGNRIASRAVSISHH